MYKITKKEVTEVIKKVEDYIYHTAKHSYTIKYDLKFATKMFLKEIRKKNWKAKAIKEGIHYKYYVITIRKKNFKGIIHVSRTVDTGEVYFVLHSFYKNK